MTCSICNKDFADDRGTLNLQKHVRVKHVDKAKKCFSEADAKQLLNAILDFCLHELDGLTTQALNPNNNN